jgi:NADP+-dependent farnesol dehydrogenase
MNKWQGKNAVVTGSSSGIGLSILKELLKHGVNVIGLARNVEKFQSLVKDEGNFGKLSTRRCDVSDPASVKEAFEWIEVNIGSVDVLVNCAGIFHFTSILNNDNLASPSLQDTMATNFLGSVYCAKEAWRSMERHGNYGCIINISSVGGHYVTRRELINTHNADI